jgi:hypothetical protein
MAATGLLIPFSRYRGTILESMRPPRLLTRHDIKVVPRAKFLDEAGVAITLTGLTVRYTLCHMPTIVFLVHRGVATQENQTTNPGEAYFPLTADHVAHNGIYREEWEIDYGAGVKESFPVSGLSQVVRILEDADGV